MEFTPGAPGYNGSADAYRIDQDNKDRQIADLRTLIDSLTKRLATLEAKVRTLETS